MPISFPDGFLWGAATSAYQVEGAVAEDGRGPSIWDTFVRIPGATVHGDTGAIAADQYHRLESDLDLMAYLGLGASRFSVAWTRIQPDGRGPINQRGLDYYKRMLDGLGARGIMPALTLYHWDLPQALQDHGGWAARDTAERFAEYAALLFAALGDRVPLWITINEPWCAAFLGYGTGLHAPGIRDEAAALAAAHHLLLGHGRAVQAFRTQGARFGQIGVTLNLSTVHAASDAEDDIAAARRVDGTENRLFLDPVFRASYPPDIVDHYRLVSDFGFVRDGDLATIASPADFFGVNYYLRHRVRADPSDLERGATFLPPMGRTTAMGIGIHPEGLEELLRRISSDYTALPLYVTENGAAFHDYVDPEGAINDDERVAFFDGHLRAVQRAIAAGVDVRGYFAWSLLDNFEWAEGYAKRYGLVYVDFGTQVRIPKRSAHWYRRVIEGNRLP